jgi:hypothetical protein
MAETFNNIGWSLIFSISGAVIGIFLLIVSTLILPSIINRMTPNIDEEKEIARGNTAVGEYFGRVVGSVILGVSIIVAAAILGGIIAALH